MDEPTIHRSRHDFPLSLYRRDGASASLRAGNTKFIPVRATLDNHKGVAVKPKTTGRVADYEKLSREYAEHEFDDATGFFGNTDEIAVEEESKRPRKRRKKKHARRQ
jgi:hypothetical protein